MLQILEVIHPGNIWTYNEDKVPCLNIDEFGEKLTIEWIKNTRKTLNWKEPTIVVIGEWRIDPDESERVHKTITSTGATYFEMSQQNTFEKYCIELDKDLVSIWND